MTEDGEGGEPGVANEATGQTASELRAAGKYVPPSMRAGANRGGGESMHMRDRDSMPTLRVTNLSEDCTDRDLWDLFGRFGRVVRIYLGKDQETGLCKGFAFVSYETKQEAEKAMGKINGLPYDHLILSCTWSGEFCARAHVRPPGVVKQSSVADSVLGGSYHTQCPRSKSTRPDTKRFPIGCRAATVL